MSAFVISLIVFAVLIASAMFGTFLRGILPKHHLSEESKDMVKVGIGLISTLAALVLGLLVASAKSSLDTKSEEVRQAAAKIVLLDRNLRQYGPEANASRERLRQLVESRLDMTWIKSFAQAARAGSAPAPAKVGIEEVQELLRSLSPGTEAQRLIRERALQLSGELAQMRWLVIAQVGSSIPTPFLVVLVFWLALIAVTVSLYAPRNGTVAVVGLVCALSVASAIFLILEMDRPFDGLVRISDVPLREAITYLRQ